MDNRIFKQMTHTHTREKVLHKVVKVRMHVKELSAGGLIRPSHSPFSSNVVLVRKANESLGLCIHYRQLNAWTIKDNYAIPRIDEILDSLLYSIHSRPSWIL